MYRCSMCDATADGLLTNSDHKYSRSFSPDKYEPWLLACSDCQPYIEPTRDYLEDELEDGEVENVSEGFD